MDNVWLKGLVAAFITGAVGAAGDALVNGAPADSAGWKRTGMMALVAGFVGVAAYLKASPLPRKEWTPEERKEKLGE